MVILIVFACIATVIGFVLVSAYNRLISLKGQTDNAWKQIDVQLKRRHDFDTEYYECCKRSHAI